MMQYPASNGEKYFFLRKIDVSRIITITEHIPPTDLLMLVYLDF